MPDVDAPVIHDVLAGNRDAYGVLVRRHRARIFAILMRLTGDPEEADELAQETFVRAYRALGGFREESQFGTWVVQIAIHLVRDRIREHQRHAIVSLDEFRERLAEQSELIEQRSTFDPTYAVDERELRERLEQELQKLPPSYREIFVLREVEQLPYEEIAMMTGDSVGSLKVRAHRARSLLKESLFHSGELLPGCARDDGR